VLERFAQWAPTAPDCVTTSLRIMQIPDMPEVPELIRGRAIVMLDGAVNGDLERAAEILAPMRELQPELDLFGVMPAPALVRLHQDPEEPMPVASATTNLGTLDGAAIDALLAACGPDAPPTPLLGVELRQLGGALGRPQAGAGALSHLHGEYVLFAFGLAMPGTHEAARAVVDAMSPWASGSLYLNFAETEADAAAAYSAQAWERLRGLRAAVDPDGLMRGNHPIR
jgi:FAD/FMN-containing dehydrogenase